jgi:hypothetical protein
LEGLSSAQGRVGVDLPVDGREGVEQATRVTGPESLVRRVPPFLQHVGYLRRGDRAAAGGRDAAGHCGMNWCTWVRTVMNTLLSSGGWLLRNYRDAISSAGAGDFGELVLETVRLMIWHR